MINQSNQQEDEQQHADAENVHPHKRTVSFPVILNHLIQSAFVVLSCNTINMYSTSYSTVLTQIHRGKKH